MKQQPSNLRQMCVCLRFVCSPIRHALGREYQALLLLLLLCMYEELLPTDAV